MFFVYYTVVEKQCVGSINELQAEGKHQTDSRLSPPASYQIHPLTVSMLIVPIENSMRLN